jgi:Flavin containing amine oxidoreductase
MNRNADFIIIGGGIAGLYAAHKILLYNPRAKLIVLERQSKRMAGGRTGNVIFRGANIVTGAGVGRKKKDKLLVKLLNDMNIETHEFKATHNYAKTIEPDCKLKETFLEIKNAYHDQIAPQTFKTFATSVIGEERYKHFVVCSGYTDYENEDVYSTLYKYGFDDNYQNWTALSIPWDELIKSLINKIGKENVLFDNEVNDIEIEDNGYKIITNKKAFYCEKVIVATTINAVLKIVPGASNKNSIYHNIKGQPFLRTYGKFSKSSLNIMREFVPALTVVPGPLQKIIPMDPEKGVYMICYNDNASAKRLKPLLEDNEENRERFCRLLEKSLGAPKDSLKLLAISDFYWETGTHYYGPLPSKYKTRSDFIKSAQNPHKNMLVVGELISTNQGWVEGALESVEKVVTRSWSV